MRCLAWTIMLSLPVNAPALAAGPEDMAKAARSVLGEGYLKPDQAPDSIAMLPLPPASGSAAEARDVELSKVALAAQGSARWVLATADAELTKPSSTAAMSCAAGFAIGEKETPAIQRLMRRVTRDLGMSGAAAKRQYSRARPFMTNNAPTCTPDWEPLLRKDGSYPSGHSAIGYGWGLILAEIVPERATQLVSRGIAFGDSRRFCNVHWAADVEAGRTTAAAMLARLHADKAFQKDVKAARKEALKARAVPPNADCAAEQAALSSSR